MRVARCPVPQDALLQRYAAQGGSYADCFETVVPVPVPLEQFVTRFYMTRLFRAERAVLARLTGRAIADADIAGMLAGGRFAVWRIEARSAGQILLREDIGQTRSWFGVQPLGQGATRLRFGSAIVAGERAVLPVSMRLVMGPHRLYSRLLLAAARRAILRQ